MNNPDLIPDENGDFRDKIDEAAPSPASPSRKDARKCYRLPQHMEAYLILEIITTNKTDAAISRKFGISRQSVCSRRKLIRESFKRQPPPSILYRKNGELFFQL